MTRLLAKMEVDRRLVGLAVVLLVIWIGFDIASGGRFITRAISLTCRFRRHPLP